MWPAQLTPDRETAVTCAKLCTAWGSLVAIDAAKLANWAQAIASIAAAIYTVLLITEFMWKKVLRPFAEWRGWMKPEEGEDAAAAE